MYTFSDAAGNEAVCEFAVTLYANGKTFSYLFVCLFVSLFLIFLEARSLYLLQRKTGDFLQLFKCKSEVHSKRVNVT